MNLRKHKGAQRTHVEKLGCIEAAAHILGDKWTLLIVGELAKAGTLRFCALQDKAGGVNPRTLSARLDWLEKEKILTKKTFTEVPPRCEYALTKKGHALMPALHAMAAWSKKYSANS